MAVYCISFRHYFNLPMNFRNTISFLKRFVSCTCLCQALILEGHTSHGLLSQASKLDFLCASTYMYTLLQYRRLHCLQSVERFYCEIIIVALYLASISMAVLVCPTQHNCFSIVPVMLESYQHIDMFPAVILSSVTLNVFLNCSCTQYRNEKRGFVGTQLLILWCPETGYRYTPSPWH